jgi:integrase
MPKRALTAAAVERIRPPTAGQIDHFDKGYPGLALRISYGGRRTWVFFHRLGGKLHRTRLGTFPAMSLAEARAAWRDARSKVELGEDPTPAKGANNDDKLNTVENAAEDFLKRHGATLRARTRIEYERPIRKLVIAKWGSRTPDDIGRSDVLALIDDVADSSGPIAANRTFAVVRKFWNWSVERGIVGTSPCATIKPPSKETSRDRVLSDKELRQLWPAFGAMKYPFGDFLHVLTLTAQRRAEVAAMRWADLELETEEPIWTISAADTKAAREHVVALAPQVVRILKSLPRWNGPYVFTTTAGDRPISGHSKAKARVDAKVLEAAQKEAKDAGNDSDETTGLADWRIHDLRRTAASNMARMGFPPHVVAAVLNHSPGSTQGITAVYNRYRYSDEKRDALIAWANHIETITE